MARAKNTARAQARRRYRQQHALAAHEPLDDEDLEPLEAEPEPEPARRPGFRLPDVRGDLRAFPGMFRERKLLWLPFVLVLGTFAAGMLANRGVLPADIPLFVVQLVLPPQALIAYFIGGFVAPRGSYLVGLLLGLMTGPLYVVWAFDYQASPIAPVAEPITTPFTELLLAYTVQGAFFGLLAGGFAAWYRNFLRSSQERAKANRAAREQQARIRAREQERQDREAAREARRAAQKPST